MTSYSFSPINWGGQGRSPTTGHIQADAGSGRRTEAKRKRARAGSAMPQPLMGHTTSSPDFESVNNFVAGLQSGDDVAMLLSRSTEQARSPGQSPRAGWHKVAGGSAVLDQYTLKHAADSLTAAVASLDALVVCMADSWDDKVSTEVSPASRKLEIGVHTVAMTRPKTVTAPRSQSVRLGGNVPVLRAFE